MNISQFNFHTPTGTHIYQMDDLTALQLLREMEEHLESMPEDVKPFYEDLKTMFGES